MKTNYKVLTNPLYMGAYSMDDGNGGYFEIPAVIKEIKQEEVADPTGTKKKCLIGYTDQPKPFILNATAQKVMTQAAKSRYVEDWAGVAITFYVALNVRTPQGPVDALRIKARTVASKVDYSTQEKMLRECKTLADLQTIYTGMTKDQQTGTWKVKEECKVNLTPTMTPSQPELI
jgi:hypothetical protein